MKKIAINKIVWWIPFRKLRDSVRNNLSEKIENYNLRHYEIPKKVGGGVFPKFRDSLSNFIYSHLEVIENSNIEVDNNFINFRVILGGIDDMDEYYSNIEDFKKGLDIDSLEVLDRRVMMIKCFANKKMVNASFRLHYTTRLMGEDQKLLCINSQEMLIDISKKYSHKYNLRDIGFGIQTHYYESGVFFLPSKIKDRLKNTVAIDVGAYVGDTAIMFLEECGLNKIHAFEPMSLNYNFLSKNIEKYNLNNKIIPHKLGCGDKNVTSCIYGEGEGSSMFDSIDNSNLEKIDVVILDDYLNDEKDISLIKMDVEGFEEQVLKGCEKIIINNKPVLIVAAYHDWYAPGQMFILKKYIENLNLGYKILYRHLCIGSTGEHYLICYVP